MRGRREMGWVAVVLMLIGFGIGFGGKATIAAQEPCRFERMTTVSGNVYEKPSADAAVKMTLEVGTSLTLVRGSSGWYMAVLPDKQLGWVFKDLFLPGPKAPGAPVSVQAAPQQPAEAEQGAQPDKGSERRAEEAPQKPIVEKARENPEMVTLKVDSGRVRESPSLDAPVEFGLTRGQTVAVMDIRGEWYHIQKSDGRTGWSHQSLFTQGQVQPASPDSPAGADSVVPANAREPEEELDQVALPEREKQVESIRVDVSGRDEEKLIIKINGFYPPETYVLEDGVPRVVCDFANVSLARGVEPLIEINGTYISRIRTERLEEEGKPRLRVVVELVPEKDYEVEQIFFKGENLYVLTFMSA